MKAKEAVCKVWPDAEPELLNKASFDFGPFSEVLFARLQQPSLKRKHPGELGVSLKS